MLARQRGITLLSFIIVLVVVGFFIYAAMRMVPVYTEYYSVKQAMAAVANEPGSGTWDARRVRDMLDRRFQVSYVETVKPEHITITRASGGQTLTVKYEVRRPFAYNVDLLMSFDHSVQLGAGGR